MGGVFWIALFCFAAFAATKGSELFCRFTPYTEEIFSGLLRRASHSSQ
jgi:hypothetical protein